MTKAQIRTRYGITIVGELVPGAKAIGRGGVQGTFRGWLGSIILIDWT
jgi:hypothetical protein